MEGRLTKQEIEAVDKAINLYGDRINGEQDFYDWFSEYKASIAVEKEKYRHALEVLDEHVELVNSKDSYTPFRSFIKSKLEE